MVRVPRTHLSGQGDAFLPHLAGLHKPTSPASSDFFLIRSRHHDVEGTPDIVLENIGGADCGGHPRLARRTWNSPHMDT